MTPDSWKQRTIAELCEMVKGSAPISKTKAGEFPLVTTGEERKTADYYQFDTTAVCVPMISSTGHGHASLKRVQYQEGKFALSNLLTALIVRDQTALSPRFLHLYLNHFKDKLIVPLMSGAANMSITVGRLATVPVRFPPLAEQARILRTLDDAEDLRHLRAQADRRTADLIPAIFYEMFGDPATNPEDVPVVTLGESCTKITDGVHITPTYVDEGVPFLRVTDIQKSNIDWASVKRIPSGEYEEITRRVKPEKGDILYSKNGTIGIAKLIDWEQDFAHFVSLALLKPDHTIFDSTYLTIFLNTNIALNQAKSHSKTGTVTNLHLVEIRKIKVPKPPISLQRVFVSKVSEVRALEESQATSRDRLDDLFQSLLHRAFTGEL